MEKRFSGRVWPMRKDIDTDIIAPTQILGLPMEEMIKHIFEPLYPDLAAQIQQGDIIVAGPNFGCGGKESGEAPPDPPLPPRAGRPPRSRSFPRGTDRKCSPGSYSRIPTTSMVPPSAVISSQKDG